MQIQFKTSGGFANLRLNYSVDTATVSSATVQELDRLVQQSGILAINQQELAAASMNVPTNVPDAMTYEMTITTGDRTHSVTMTDVNMPSSVRPLVQRLRSLAIEQAKQG
ncbi:protealysin inhibitor emfourin [Leptolyngbya sp. AN02str]|uniref:protealysin inhibitor emfourin n=1 Tax=Leptolyngbya sp. AN02str TaxID=3423363 RepID=UPI003D318896